MSKAPDQKRRLNLFRFGTVVGVLVTLWLVASTVTVFGTEGSETFPSITNTKPSGTAAFAELLRRDGYQVRLDRDQRPRLKPEEISIGFPVNWFQFDFEDATDQVEVDPYAKTIDDHVKNGGTALVLPLPHDFGQASLQPVQATVQMGEKKYTVSSGDLEQQWSFDEETVPTQPEEQEESPYPVQISVENTNEGQTIEVTNALGTTNRFLDQEQNAQFYLDLVRSIAPAGSTLVFTEASFGNVANRTLLDEFGGWLTVAVWQFFLVLAVFLYAAGRRFGYPVADRLYERGTNELLVSMGSALHRARKHDQALMILLDDAYERIRTALNAPLGTDAAELTKQAPPTLSRIILSARQLYGTKQPRKLWLELASGLEKELSAFEAESKSRRTRRQ